MCAGPTVEANVFKTCHVRDLFHSYNLSLEVYIFYKIKQDFDTFNNTYLSRDKTYDLRVAALSTTRSRTNYGKQSSHHQIEILCNTYQSIVQIAVQSTSVLMFKKKVKMLFSSV